MVFSIQGFFIAWKKRSLARQPPVLIATLAVDFNSWWHQSAKIGNINLEWCSYILKETELTENLKGIDNLDIVTSSPLICRTNTKNPTPSWGRMGFRLCPVLYWHMKFLFVVTAPHFYKIKFERYCILHHQVWLSYQIFLIIYISVIRMFVSLPYCPFSLSCTRSFQAEYSQQYFSILPINLNEFLSS